MDDVEITDPKCDINRVRRKMGMAGEIDSHCDRSRIPPRQASRIRLAFEGLARRMPNTLTLVFTGKKG